VPHVMAQALTEHPQVAWRAGNVIERIEVIKLRGRILRRGERYRKNGPIPKPLRIGPVAGK
jgi:hypothetical protein